MLGLGLSSLVIDNRYNLKFEDASVTLEDLYKKLLLMENKLPGSSKGDSVDMDFEGLLFQQRIDNHPDIRKLTGFKMLQTVRVCTYVTDDNQVEILFAFMKLAGKEGLADAFNLGKTGNMLAEIDPKSGKLRQVYAMDQQQGFLVHATHHPVTQIDLRGFSIPCWRSCKLLAEKVSLTFLPLRAIGWDIAITDQGPMVLEGNENWVPVIPFTATYEKLELYGLKH